MENINILNDELMKRLSSPQGYVDVVIDTDTYNEIDDQYALAYLLKSNDKLNTIAIYAAPFSNEKAKTPKEGMELSYHEIMNILSLMEKEKLKDIVKKGSDRYLENENKPVISDAVLDLIDKSKTYSKERPLYVVAIAALTNIASALLLDHSLKDRIVVIWLGGQAHHWPELDNKEFNMLQDIAAARVVFDSQVPFVQLPCMGVVSSFRISEPELLSHLKGKNALCDYLVETTIKEAKKNKKMKTWSRAIWDVTAVAWLLNDFTRDIVVPAPIPRYDNTYDYDNKRHVIKYVYHINRDLLFEDLVYKLSL